MALRTRVKICGITSREDAQAAVAAGADALGFVFYPPSPRAVTVEQVAVICRGLPPFVTRVGLFLDAGAAEVRAALDVLPLDLLQFHGSETAEQCNVYGRPYMKAIGTAGQDDLVTRAEGYPDAAAWLFDSHQQGEAGGTGQIFDWSRLPANTRRPLVLSGGLNVDNVADAVRQVQPFAVDVSSGVEQAPGRKDALLMQDFVAQVQRADRETGHNPGN